MKQSLLLCLLLFSAQLSAQIVGKVTNTSGDPLSYVNIYLDNTYTGTTSNDDGNYELSAPRRDKCIACNQCIELCPVGALTIEVV